MLSQSLLKKNLRVILLLVLAHQVLLKITIVLTLTRVVVETIIIIIVEELEVKMIDEETETVMIKVILIIGATMITICTISRMKENQAAQLQIIL